MPNWVFNGLTIEGKPESITKLTEQLNQPFKMVHDLWNTTTGQMEKKLTTYSNPVFAFWNIIKPTDIEAYENQPNHKANQSIEDMMKHDGDDWYNWNMRNGMLLYLMMMSHLRHIWKVSSKMVRT